MNIFSYIYNKLTAIFRLITTYEAIVLTRKKGGDEYKGTTFIDEGKEDAANWIAYLSVLTKSIAVNHGIDIKRVTSIQTKINNGTLTKPEDIVNHVLPEETEQIQGSESGVQRKKVPQQKRSSVRKGARRVSRAGSSRQVATPVQSES